MGKQRSSEIGYKFPETWPVPDIIRQKTCADQLTPEKLTEECWGRLHQLLVADGRAALSLGEFRARAGVLCMQTQSDSTLPSAERLCPNLDFWNKDSHSSEQTMASTSVVFVPGRGAHGKCASYLGGSCYSFSSSAVLYSEQQAHVCNYSNSSS